MAYRVDISRPAVEDAEAAYLWMRETSPEKAAEWFVGLMDAIFSLENMPERCPVAPESREFIIEVRQLLYGKRRNAFVFYSASHTTTKRMRTWYAFTGYVTAHNAA